jgi:hypothetical protein
VVALAVYLGSFLRFTLHNGSLVDMRNGELVYDAPDNVQYRLMALFYVPILYVSHSRIHLDPGTSK